MRPDDESEDERRPSKQTDDEIDPEELAEIAPGYSKGLPQVSPHAAFVLGDSAHLGDIKPEAHPQTSEQKEERAAGENPEAGGGGRHAVANVGRQRVHSAVQGAKNC